MNRYLLDFEVSNDLVSYVFSKILEEKRQGVTGYYDLPYTSMELLEKIEANDFDQIVVIGIGGSSLGTKAINSFLQYKADKEILFLESPDPIALENSFQKITKNAIFIVVSKSGKTIETLSIFKALLQRFSIDLRKNKERFIVITDKDTPLFRFAKHYDIETFTIPANVGGRFSVLSAVGIVPLTLAGYDTKALLQGARRFLEHFFEQKEQHILKKAVFIYQNWCRYPINVLFNYANELEDFGKWYVQLWAESLGKIDTKGESVGLTPIALVGPNDQHSFLQLLMQGPRDKSVTFVTVEDFGSELLVPQITLPSLQSSDFVNGLTFAELLKYECEATKKSLQTRDIPIDHIVLERIEEASIGELIIYYELLTSLVGILFDISTYDQPGVELGKNLLRSKLERF